MRVACVAPSFIDRRALRFSAGVGLAAAGALVGLPNAAAAALCIAGMAVLLTFVRSHDRQVIVALGAAAALLQSANFDRDRRAAPRLIASNPSPAGGLHADLVDSGDWHGVSLWLRRGGTPLRYLLAREWSDRIGLPADVTRTVWSVDGDLLAVIAVPNAQGDLWACAANGEAVMSVISTKTALPIFSRDY